MELGDMVTGPIGHKEVHDVYKRIFYKFAYKCDRKTTKPIWKLKLKNAHAFDDILI